MKPSSVLAVKSNAGVLGGGADSDFQLTVHRQGLPSMAAWHVPGMLSSRHTSAPRRVCFVHGLARPLLTYTASAAVALQG